VDGGGRLRNGFAAPHRGDHSPDCRHRGGTAWVQPARNQREALTLDAAKVAADLGVDVNAAKTDKRTALDAARMLGYETVVKFLVHKGAKSDRPVQKKAPTEE
jgi:hypothetical protein